MFMFMADCRKLASFRYTRWHRGRYCQRLHFPTYSSLIRDMLVLYKPVILRVVVLPVSAKNNNKNRRSSMSYYVRRHSSVAV